jgi:hypothetical protein
MKVDYEHPIQTTPLMDDDSEYDSDNDHNFFFIRVSYGMFLNVVTSAVLSRRAMLGWSCLKLL